MFKSNNQTFIHGTTWQLWAVGWSDGQIFVAMWWQWSFFQSGAILIFLDTVTHITIATDYLGFTIVDDVFRCFVFHFFWWFSWFSQVFLRFFMASGWRSKLFKAFWCFWVNYVNNTIFLLNYQDRCFCDVFEVHWSSYTIISDSRQPSVQRCNVCDVSLNSNEQISQRRFCAAFISHYNRLKK